MNRDVCPICQQEADVYRQSDSTAVACVRCGKFRLSKLADPISPQPNGSQLANMSGWIREHEGCLITPREIEQLLKLSVPAIGEKADKLLFYLSQLHPKPGSQFQVGVKDSQLPVPILLGVSWAQDSAELNFLLDDYLCGEQRFMEKLAGMKFYKISPRGWAYIHEIRKGLIESEAGFVAMWFNEAVNGVYASIEAAISNAGYKSLRIDKHQHNNRIDDEILAGIRRSKFLVADFTGQRGGVYFEAGFALGLGRPVIWLCRKDDLAKVHFDNRQYNFILWEDGKLDELLKALQNRIEATIGRGPFAKSA